jgi:site-specific DNA-methyltransferase (adenine-specific)
MNEICNLSCLDYLKTCTTPIDLTVTSPPYNLDIDYGAKERSDKMNYDLYLDWSFDWLKSVWEASKQDGRLCLNIPLDSNKNGKRSVYADILKMAIEAGWKYQTTILWDEGNISRRTAWGSWLSASAPFVTAPVEMILVLYKSIWKKQARGVSDISRDEFIAWTNGSWKFSGEKKKNVGGHPAAFPKELPKRCIKLYSYVGDLVFDPFAGSGTTLVAAKEFKRQYLGTEINSEYCEFAKKRLEMVKI